MFSKVSIIILNWNGKEDTIECLESLKHITYPTYEILLVDNGSTDGSVECIKERYPEIEIIENKENLFFAEGNNVGIREAMKNLIDYILLLNNDTIVSPDFLTKMVEVAESNTKFGIVGPKICYYHDLSKVWSVGVDVNLFTGSIKNKGDQKSQEVFQGTKIVDYVSGCALLIKKKVVEEIGFCCKNNFTAFLDYNYCFLYHY